MISTQTPTEQRTTAVAPIPTGQTQGPWSETEKIAFRIAFVFFLAMALPNNVGWYRDFFALDWKTCTTATCMTLPGSVLV